MDKKAVNKKIEEIQDEASIINTLLFLGKDQSEFKGRMNKLRLYSCSLIKKMIELKEEVNKKKFWRIFE